jgi:hypothetical protein
MTMCSRERNVRKPEAQQQYPSVGVGALQLCHRYEYCKVKSYLSGSPKRAQTRRFVVLGKT